MLAETGPPQDATSTADPVAASAVYPRGSRVNEAGHLEIGGCDAVELAREFGTPAYVYATDDIRARARAYVDAFGAPIESTARSSSPARRLRSPRSARSCARRACRVDVASGGELAHRAEGRLRPGADLSCTATTSRRRSSSSPSIAASAPSSSTRSTRSSARDSMLDRAQDVLIRLTPGIRPSTHSYVQTGQLDSKFGFGLAGGQAAAAVERDPRPRGTCDLVGLHAHIGSQIFELEPYVRGDRGARRVRRRALRPQLLNVGGGLGIAYRPATSRRRSPSTSSVKVGGDPAALRPAAEDPPRAGALARRQRRRDLYTVGTVKEIPGVRTYVAVDGGMSDNLRPMLYGSRTRR